MTDIILVKGNVMSWIIGGVIAILALRFFQSGTAAQVAPNSTQKFYGGPTQKPSDLGGTVEPGGFTGVQTPGVDNPSQPSFIGNYNFPGIIVSPTPVAPDSQPEPGLIASGPITNVEYNPAIDISQRREILGAGRFGALEV